MATLYVVATPIGNLADISARAIEVLRFVDRILAEDTRVTRRLLERYQISVPLEAYHQHSTLNKIGHIVGMLRDGKSIALVSDAGTPGISDPGGKLIAAVAREVPECYIVPVPGANAAIAALSISGFPADEFTFLGFPPHKKGRQTFFVRIGEMKETVVFYESKHRIIKALEQLRDVAKIGERPLVVARELTKQFETIYRGTVDEVLRRLTGDKVLGEFVVVIAPWR